jgi:type I restriction enzyme S subunit
MINRPGFKTTEIADMPEEWRVTVLSDAAQVNPSRPLVVGREYPFIPMDALTTDSPRVIYTLRRVWNRSSGSRFQNGDVLLARITPSAENGKTALVDFLRDGGRGFGSTEFLVLGPENGGIEDSKFLYYLIKFDKIRNQAIQRMTGSTGRQRIPPDAFNDIQCPVPPVPEQRKISSTLSAVDDAIQKTNEIVAKTQQLKKGLMQQLLTKGIGHTKFKQTEVGEIPEEWHLLPCERACTEITVGVVSSATPYYVEKGVPFLRSQNIKENSIDTTDLRFISEEFNQSHRKSILRQGDVVTVRTGEPGTSCVVPREYDGSNCFSLIISRPSKDLLPQYLSYYINSQYARRFIASREAGGVQHNFNVSFMKKLPVPVGSLAEQERIVFNLSVVDDKLLKESRRKEHLELLKKGLMQALLTGRVRVKVS